MLHGLDGDRTGGRAGGRAGEGREGDRTAGQAATEGSGKLTGGTCRAGIELRGQASRLKGVVVVCRWRDDGQSMRLQTCSSVNNSLIKCVPELCYRLELTDRYRQRDCPTDRQTV